MKTTHNTIRTNLSNVNPENRLKYLNKKVIDSILDFNSQKPDQKTEQKPKNKHVSFSNPNNSIINTNKNIMSYPQPSSIQQSKMSYVNNQLPQANNNLIGEDTRLVKENPEKLLESKLNERNQGVHIQSDLYNPQPIQPNFESNVGQKITNEQFLQPQQVTSYSMSEREKNLIQSHPSQHQPQQQIMGQPHPSQQQPQQQQIMGQPHPSQQQQMNVIIL